MGNWEEIGSANTVSSENIGTVTGVTASEVANSVYQETGGGLLMELSVTSTTSAAAYPVRERLWINFDDGRGDVLIGDKYASGSSTTWVIGVPNQQTGITVAPQDAVWVPTDPTKINWRATVEANSNALTPGAGAQHYDFTVTPAQATPATDITGIQFVPNAATGDLITYALNDPGVYQWIFNELDYTQPATSSTIAGGDPYFKSSFCTVQLGYAASGTGTITGGTSLQSTAGAAFSASDVGNRIHVGPSIAFISGFTDSTHVTLDRAVTNGAGQSYEIWRPAPVDSVNGIQGQDDPDARAQGYWGRRFTDGPPPSVLGSSAAQFIGVPSWTIPPTTLPDGSTNLYRTFRFWVWAVSRLADNESGGTSTITLQSGWAGAADHYDLNPQPQTAALDLTKSKASTLGNALGKEVGTGRLKVNINASTALAVNGSNELYVPIASDFVVSGGQLTQNIVNLAKAVNFSAEFTTSGGIMAMNQLAVNKLIAGDALFAGQATFATSGGGKVIINSSGVTIQNKITSPTASVTIGSSSVVITGSAGTLTADSGGVTIANGSSSVQVTSAAVTINNGSFTATAGTITVNVDSSNYVLVTNSGSTIWAQHQYAYFRVQRSTDSLWYGQLSLANLQLSTSGGGNSLSLTPTSFSMTGLPSSNPGAGSKQFWYDPSDGNRVKFAA